MDCAIDVTGETYRQKKNKKKNYDESICGMLWQPVAAAPDKLRSLSVFQYGIKMKRNKMKFVQL